jgi:osmotically-inducible protein OsmY
MFAGGTSMRPGRTLIAAALCAAFAACSAQQQQQTQRSAQSTTLAAAVQARLAAVDADAATMVNVDAKDGIVTLTGQAHDAHERSSYAAAAATVPGVKRVVDRLRVNPKARGPREDFADAALATKVNANIAAQAGVNVTRVKTSVRDGVVTLSGTVPAASLKATIVDTVRKTSGVKSVVDRIEVQP